MLYLTRALRLGREYGTMCSFIVAFIVSQAHDSSILLISSAKRFYDSSRPITAIQCLYDGMTVKSWRGPYLGVGDIDGSEWMPVSCLPAIVVCLLGNKSCC
jgi:hypothetical protein